MFEVLEIVSKVVLLLALFIIARNDYKTQLLDSRQLLIVGVLGLLLCGNVIRMYRALGGVLIGIMVLIGAWCSNESIGFGDGWIFVVTGIFLGFQKNMMLFFWTLVLAGVFAIVCLILKKKRRNDSMALGPFVLTAYVLFVL